jgi:DnaK suppressor protein
MNPTELARLRVVLESRQAELEGLLRNREAIAADLSADVFDQIQRAAECDMAIDSRERDSARLREVRAALRRIQNTTYGTCLECEEPIGLKRLTAVPWTSFCIECQQAAERAQSLPDNAEARPVFKAA